MLNLILYSNLGEFDDYQPTNNMYLLDISQKDNYKWITKYNPLPSTQSATSNPTSTNPTSIPNTPNTIITTETPDPNPSASPSKTGIIVGGIVGGIIGFVVSFGVIITVRYVSIYRRNKRNHPKVSINDHTQRANHEPV